MTQSPHPSQLCIHGHFYQPPREDPLTNTIPDEPGSEPFRNWNQRITEYCYRPNAELGNFAKISFNLGPTLVTWLRSNEPEVLARIVADDKRNFCEFGTGNALAQPFHHTILPLGDSLEKKLQVRWGIRSFEHTFGHKPEGMWLPETAVDDETLSVLSEEGIDFTILAPWQIELLHGEPGMPARVDLVNGRSIIVFPYDSGLSTQLSFDSSSTNNAEHFCDRVINGFDETRKESLLLIASDGELYGHHQPFRDKFLSHLMNGASSSRGIHPTYPGLWLKSHAVTNVARIRQNSSWSCHHGIERWRGVCDCGGETGWKPAFYSGLKLLAQYIDGIFIEYCQQHSIDPINLLMNYVDVEMGNRSYEDWIKSMVSQPDQQMTQEMDLLLRAEMNRHRMFASCAWFFGDLQRLEPQNALKYAARSTWLIRKCTGNDLEQKVRFVLNGARMSEIGVSAGDSYQRYYHEMDGHS